MPPNDRKQYPLTLRLRHFSIGVEHRVEITLDGDGLPRQTATVHFWFDLTAHDQHDLHWYLENYLHYPFDPAPKIAARIEQRMVDIGTELFKALFHANDDARELWSLLRPHLDDVRVEIIAEVREAAIIPWELLRDPRTDVPLALRARSFVRAQPTPVQRPQLPTGDSPIRILLVICRPRGKNDVAFRSVASRIVKGLGKEAHARFNLKVLRPPTFEQLGRELRRAKAAGEPYHIVHFDGHGTYKDLEQAGGSVNDQAFHRSGKHGLLVFENPVLDSNHELVDGLKLGNVLVENDVPVLVLNACRSAHAEDQQPAHAVQRVEEQHNGEPPLVSVIDDPHQHVRAFGSLAQEIMDTGVAGVVAMRYNIYVVTAAQFVAEVYETLLQGCTLGEAVTRGRKHLADEPRREVVSAPLPLQDWSVPVVYEAAPIALFPHREHSTALSIVIGAADTTAARGMLAPDSVTIPPDAGFFGRDETLLALDRAFDTQRIVLLQAFAGSGKTTTAAEFARWYAETGGVEGPVLFTSFEQHKPLPRVLDALEQVFGAQLKQASSSPWLAMTVTQRRDVALQVLQQIPVLWIWDNVEPVAGFPAGTSSAWSTEEQRELADFLRIARTTKAKFLLTSRRDERVWLGDLPQRIHIPPMPMQERVQLARALAEKYGRHMSSLQDWQPLLQYTQGNPLTITVVVGQALRNGLQTRNQIEEFVAQLRSGEAALGDEASQGRAASLGASLSYGFRHAFTEDECTILALLFFFQNFVDVDALCVMGDATSPWCLTDVRGLTYEAGTALLDRAAEVGLLTGHGDGFYTIHPALPWYFMRLFTTAYAYTDKQRAATRAFVATMGQRATTYHIHYDTGNRDVVTLIEADEANLLYAWQVARSSQWWDDSIRVMQGLRMLYNHTGQATAWKQLVEKITLDMVNPATGDPLPDCEEQWHAVIDYRVRLLHEARDLTEAERLQHTQIPWLRRHAAAALAVPRKKLTYLQGLDIRNLAAGLNELGDIRRGRDQSDCVKVYTEAIRLLQRIGDQPTEAAVHCNLGHAYKGVSALRNLDRAERAYQQSLKLRYEYDRVGRAKCLDQLGSIAYERFLEAQVANQSDVTLHGYLSNALTFHCQALDLFPPDAVYDLGVVHSQLGRVYQSSGKLSHALGHYSEAVRLFESAYCSYDAGQSRYTIACVCAQMGSFNDALHYAQAALRNFEPYGAGAHDMIGATRELIADIEEDLQNE